MKSGKTNRRTSRETMDLSASREPLPADFDDLVGRITESVTSDDMTAVRIDPLHLAYFHIETIVDLKRLHEEIVPQFERFSASPGKWKMWFSRGESRERLADALSDLTRGNVLIVHRDLKGQAVSIPLPEFKTRKIETPKIEKVLLGAKESYVEDLDTNVSMLRRWIKDINLTVNYCTAGERTKSKIALVYFRDMANPEWVEEITANLKKINIDRILGHKDLMEQIIGRNQTVFPLYEMTEVPARTAYFLNEGRIAILLEGSPFAAILPTVLVNMLQAAEYLGQGSLVPLFVRLIRLLSAFLALYAPAIYVALVSVNTGIIPSELGFTIASDRSGIPYPVVVEALALFITLDIFLESTSFVPGVIGPAVNIVGSLVIGQAAAQANLVSQTSIIFAAITAIGTFLSMFQMTYALRIWKYPLLIAASFLGVFGIIAVTVVMVGHLAGLKSLGVPYLSPLAPLRLKDLISGFFTPRDISEDKKRLQMWKTVDQNKQGTDPDA
mgnify:CR=1 FL=1